MMTTEKMFTLTLSAGDFNDLFDWARAGLSNDATGIRLDEARELNARFDRLRGKFGIEPAPPIEPVPSYDVNYSAEQIAAVTEQIPGESLIAIDRRAVQRVGRAFALRPKFMVHPSGVGLYMMAFALDHVPSGRRVILSDEQSCRNFVRSLETLPIDWADIDANNRLTEAMGQFCIVAGRLAEGGQAIVWGDWLENDYKNWPREEDDQ